MLSPENQVVPDISRRLPGRGVWVLNSHEALSRAIARKAFNKAWCREVIVPKKLLENVDKSLERHALNFLSLANKSGCVTCGYENVIKQIENLNQVLLIQASDASSKSRKKMCYKYHNECKISKKQPRIIDLYTVEQISLALGKVNVVHAALDFKAVTDEFAKASLRAKTFRSNTTVDKTSAVAPQQS